MSRESGNYLLNRDFDRIEQADGSVCFRPRTPLKALGEPPWELVVDDFWEELIPQECTDLVGAVIWRGVRFVRNYEHRAYGHRWMPTSISYETDADVSKLREVYVNGERFVRPPACDHDDIDVLE